MSKNNSVRLIGNLGQAPVIKYFESGKVKTKFSIAVKEFFKNDSQKTTWINCEAWEHTAEYIGEYSKSGSYALVEGALRIESYVAEDGTNKKRVFVAVSDFRLLQGKNN